MMMMMMIDSLAQLDC